MIKLSPTQSNVTVLAGAQNGRLTLARWIEAIPKVSTPHRVFLDFSEVEAVTASFLRESVFAFRDHTRRFATLLYPVIANPQEAVEDELTFFAEEVGDAIWCCDLSDSGEISNTRLIGLTKLDTGQQDAFAYVQKIGKASAPSIAKDSESTIGTTAWNNRLAGLSSRGLVVEERSGKTKVFHSIWRV